MSFFKKMASKLIKRHTLDSSTSASNFQQYKKKRLSDDKQVELEALYYQLLNKREYTTSGKLQFLGLDKIKKKMGKKWIGLQGIIYETAEEVINKNISTSDIHFLYKEDCYVIIFTNSTTDEISEKINLIADEIRRLLFALDEEELRELEIKQEVSRVATKSFLDYEFPQMLDYVFQQYNTTPSKANITKLSEINSLEVDTQGYKYDVSTFVINPKQKENLEFSFLPMWDVKRTALTTYLCVGKNKKETTNGLDAQRFLYRDNGEAENVALDIAILERALNEIEMMERDGRKLIVMCPVRYETLYRFESYEAYKLVLQKIPTSQIQFFNLLIINPGDKRLILKDIFWFSKPLKAYCYNILALVSDSYDLNYKNIKASEIDGLGIQLNSHSTEEANISQLNNLASKSRYYKIPKIFAVDISSLSITTSLVCSGYDYLSGVAIHEQVSRPDTAHMYGYEDLLSNLIK